jgi:hypothetical protein
MLIYLSAEMLINLPAEILINLPAEMLINLSLHTFPVAECILRSESATFAKSALYTPISVAFFAPATASLTLC